MTKRYYEITNYKKMLNPDSGKYIALYCQNKETFITFDVDFQT